MTTHEPRAGPAGHGEFARLLHAGLATPDTLHHHITAWRNLPNTHPDAHQPLHAWLGLEWDTYRHVMAVWHKCCTCERRPPAHPVP